MRRNGDLRARMCSVGASEHYSQKCRCTTKFCAIDYTGSLFFLCDIAKMADIVARLLGISQEIITHQGEPTSAAT